MGNNWRRVNLGARDYEIMGAIEKWGILGLGQLEGLAFKKEAGSEERTRLFFNEAGREIYTKACYKRLSDLEGGGYVRSQYYLNHRKLYTLTQEGHEALILAGKAKLPGFRRTMSETFLEHEINVNGVGLVMTQLLGLRVATERQMAEWNTNGARAPKGQESFPDLWIVDKENGSKAVEVELKQKSELRYKEIFYRYYHMVGYGGAVLYLASWPKGPAVLWKIAKKYDRPFIYVASLQEFRNKQGRCNFIGFRSHGYYFPGQKESLTLAPTEEPTPAEAVPAPTPPAEKTPVAAAAQSVQEAPPKASLDAPQEPAQWAGGPRTNPYLHLPPPLRPEGWR